DHLDRVLQIVESHQRLDKEEKNLRHAEGIFFIAGDVVKLLDRIVGNITEGAAEKGRHTGHRHRPAAAEQLLENLERRLGAEPARSAALDDFHLCAARLENPAGPGAEE